MDGKVKIGVLAFQGDVSEHLEMVKATGAQAVPVKRPYELEIIDGLILPGGESTTMGFLLKHSGLGEAIKKRAGEGMPIWGTCMGAILMARHLADNPIEQPILGLMDITVRRNAWGRQRESFEEEIPIPRLKHDAFACVFIRAPWIESVGPSCEILATHQGKIILAEESNLLASAFHPELARDVRIHHYFLEKIKERGLTS